MIPASGTAYETTFNIDCPTPFTDAEIPLTYDVGYRTSDGDVITWFYQGMVRPQQIRVHQSMHKHIRYKQGYLTKNVIYRIRICYTFTVVASSR